MDASSPRIALIVLCLLASLAACTQTQSAWRPPAPSAPRARTLAADDAAVLEDSLDALPIQHRKNVVVFQNGRIISDSPALAKRAFYYRATSLPNVFIDGLGRSVVLPEATLDTGVAHTKYSKASDNDDFVQADVTVPCGNTELLPYENSSAKEGGDVYVGGKTPTNQADFGLLFVSHVSAGGKINDVYPANVAEAFANDDQAGPPVGSIPEHFACGRSITESFYVTYRKKEKDYALVLDIFGERIMRPVSANLGWALPCVQCQVKRVTSIAVTTGEFAKYDGSYFGIELPWATPAPSAPKPVIRWSSATEGSGGKKHPWRESSCQDLPGSAQRTGLIRVNYNGPANELVGINEVGPLVRINTLRALDGPSCN
jgi:hypothetical protein